MGENDGGGGWGCLKIGCVIVLLFFVLSIVGTVAFFRSLDDNTDDVALEEFAADTEVSFDDDATPTSHRSLLSREPAGRLILELSQGEFYVHAGRPGEETYAEGDFPEDAFELVETRESLGGDKWEHTIRFGAKKTGLFGFIDAIRNDESAELHVYVSPDDPIELVIKGHQCGMEVDLGGLWLTRSQIGFHQGGGILEFSEPLREPMDHLIVTSRMGGAEIRDVALASPARLDARMSMGGAEIDLDGEWAQDVDVNLDVYMGGVECRVPDDVAVEGVSVTRHSTRVRETEEIPERTMHFDVSVRMGEVEVDRR